MSHCNFGTLRGLLLVGCVRMPLAGFGEGSGLCAAVEAEGGDEVFVEFEPDAMT